MGAVADAGQDVHRPGARGAGDALPDMLVHLAVFGAVYFGAWLGLPNGRRATAEAVEVLKEMRGRPAPLPTEMEEES